MYKTVINTTAFGEEEPKKNPLIVANLTANSVETLKAFLRQRRKYADSVETPSVRKFICIKSSSNENDIHVFEPLFGERVVFRLKGIIETECKTSNSSVKPPPSLVAVGRLSSMIGDIQDEDYIVSLPIEEESEADSLKLMDLPTRLFRIPGVREKSFWQGNIPPGVVLGRSYPSQSATYTLMPPKKQILLEARICSSEYSDADGNCTFDRSSITPDFDSDSESTKSAATTGEGEEGGAAEEKETNPEAAECPLCRFMKGGPCKDAFLAWSDCMSALKEGEDVAQCFASTADMMRCMRKEEYYDIMVVGMDFSKLDAIDKTAADTAARA